jgi:hypothetical protein
MLLSKVERAHFAIIAAVLLVGALMGTSILALLVVAGLGYAAVTGNCLGRPYVEQLLDKLGVEK